MKNLNRILWGIALVLLGVVLALKALNIVNFDIFFNGWWTLIIIIPCLIGLISDKDKTASLIGLIIGVLLLLACQGFIGFDMLWKLLVPAIIILVGVRLIFGSFFNKRSAEVRKKLKEKGETLKSYNAVFSGQDIKAEGEVFMGAELNAIFGGITLDLSSKIIGYDCVINASAIFGGIDIILPDGVNVKVNSNSVFGGISNKRNKANVENAVTVYINGTCMFGGIDIK